MKEVIHDVEWSQSNSVTIMMKKEPKMIKFSCESHGGDVEVVISRKIICSCILFCFQVPMYS